MEKNILFISADKKISRGVKNNFYYALLGLATRFFHVHVITATDEKGLPISISKNITLHPSPFTSKNAQDVWKVRKFFVEKTLSLHKKTPFHLIACDIRSPMFSEIKAAIEIARQINIPLAAEFLNTPGLPESRSSAEVIQKMLVKDFLQLHTPDIDLFRVNSLAETKTFLHDELHISFEKICALPPYYIHRETFKDQLQEREPYSCLFAGPLEKYTGVYQLIDAAQMLKVIERKIKLYLMGEGPLKAELKQYVKERGLEKNVVFLRWPVSLKSLALQYGRVSAFVMPYYSQLNYRICLEAMSCKTPTLIAINSSNPEYFANGQNVLQFEYGAKPLASALRRIFSDSDLASKIAINGYDSAANFEFRKALNHYSDLYWRLAIAKDQSRTA